MSRKALCIEPSDSLRAILTGFLESKGWTVLACADLGEFAERLDGGGADLVITAVALASAGYGEVVRQLHEREETANVPVLLLASPEDDEHRETAFEKGIAEIFFRDDLVAFEAYLDAFPHHDQSSFLAGLRVLVLDGDWQSARYVRDILTGFGMLVDAASSVDEGLAMAAAKRYDLFVVDSVLREGQSGAQFVRQLRQSGRRVADAPVIAISAYCDVATRVETLRAGAHVLLDKPIDEAELSFHAHNLLVPPVGYSLRDEELADAARPFGLSKRECIICGLAVAGHPDKRIAEQLGISFWTVRSHLTNIFRKCGVVNRIELASLLLRGDQGVTAREWQVSLASGNQISFSSQVLDALRHGVMVVGANLAILYVNQAFSRMTGYTSAETIGQTPRLLHSGRQDVGFYRALFRKLDEENGWHGEIWNRHKDGRAILQYLDISVLDDFRGGEVRYVAVYLDAAEIGLVMNRIQYAALHDALTGLANRRLLQDRGSQEIARAKRLGGKLAVVFIDLDDFKTVNDKLGHKAGDGLLTEVAKRLRASLRDVDTLARFGGDEFVALLPDLRGQEGGIALVRRLLEALTQPVTVNDTECRVGASIGISVYPEHGDDLEQLIDCADMAMYLAKEAGGTCVCVYGE